VDQEYKSMDAVTRHPYAWCVYSCSVDLSDEYDPVPGKGIDQCSGSCGGCCISAGTEKLGEKNLFSNINPFDKNRENERFSDETMEGIVRACYEMGSVCTGALIVVEQAIQLTEYEMTGIELDCKVSSQVLINIFEHNTPLHDGAVIIRGNRITSATCYLPLSDNMTISKDLGTRHRAALGMSEVCDALVIVVSEETGLVSVASGGRLSRGINAEELRKELSQIQYRNSDPKKKKFTIRKGWHR
jgi:diadenylate cyclase